jgi:hypothetical protein
MIIREPGLLMRTVDVLLDRSIMPIAAGTFSEACQRTHRWNWQSLTDEEKGALDPALMVEHRGGVSAARWKYGLPLMHLPRIEGGWRRYVVLEPVVERIWHPGWIAGDAVGVSRYAVSGSARLLYEGGDVSFFAIMNRTGQQLKLNQIGVGSIGDGGPYKDLPLF